MKLFNRFKEEKSNIKVDLVFVGLGNPGSKYKNTRHNIGRMLINTFAEKHSAEWKSAKRIYWETVVRFKGKNILLCKPDTYMNNSGEAVRKVIAKYHVPVENIIIFVDEYNFPIDRIQLKCGGSDGGHNGTSSVIEELNNNDFYRLRIGIGKDFAPGEMVEYVLSKFTEKDMEAVNQTIEKAITGLEHLIGIDKLSKAASDINSGRLWKKDEESEKDKEKKDEKKVEKPLPQE